MGDLYLIPPTSTIATTTNLQLFLNFLSTSWSYYIFWRHSPNLLFLSWSDGLFFNSLSTSNSNDPEWFYILSLAKSFPSTNTSSALSHSFSSSCPIWLVGANSLQVSGCDRAREAQFHGIQTLVFIPISGTGVLELGSSLMIPENLSLIQHIKSLLSNSLSPHGMDLNKEISMSSLNSNYPKEPRQKKKGTQQETPAKQVALERKRREKLNHRFYDLRSVVPNISRMDKASLLSDAVSYINELRTKVEELQAEVKLMKSMMTSSSVSEVSAVSAELEVRLMGGDAVIQFRSESIGHPTAMLMGVLRELDLDVLHATISNVNKFTWQNVVVRVPLKLRSEQSLKAALASKLVKT
ncbi:Transcription factor MYC/MYB N-terminal protein [Dioscorea alata]|uniref:Transcription factor MYC/MYB N-terminal protein n=1 Tax=Dioscorea alata TaxID=55571 RepID=A0ACB7WQB2_DIOAL|nr:Transcription factor MYC/MYB N-terminal protein [Dioscorea alata]